MIYIGIDDTDTLDTPGTNQLARHLVRELTGLVRGRVVTRHQLLEDPRIPCTRKNGCAAIECESASDLTIDALAARIRPVMLAWCPPGSDPGLCIATSPISEAVVEFGRQCQRRLLSQVEARELAADQGIYLAGLGGTQDGVIGALAAVGLINTRNDGRVVYSSSAGIDHFDITGVHGVAAILGNGVDEVRCYATSQRVTAGTIDVGKRLRPNYRDGRVVLFVSLLIGETSDWRAERIV